MTHPRGALMAVAAMIEGAPDSHRRRRPLVHCAADASTPSHPVREMVIALRRVYLAFIGDQLRRVGHCSPDTTAEAMLTVLTGAATAQALESYGRCNNAAALRAYVMLIDGGLTNTDA